MTHRTTDISPRAYARVAGLLGLVMLATGSFAGAVHSRLVVSGDAAATAANITASPALFRLSSVSILLMNAAFILQVWVLYRLLRPVNASRALLMVMLALAGGIIGMLNQVHQSAALLLVSGTDSLQAFSPDQLHAQVMLFLDLHKQGGLVAVIFYGLWLFPLGLLVFESGCFPKLLGTLLMIGCFGYLMLFVQRVFFPGVPALAYTRFAAHIAELSWMCWLLIKGVNVERWKQRALDLT